MQGGNTAKGSRVWVFLSEWLNEEHQVSQSQGSAAELKKKMFPN